MDDIIERRKLRKAAIGKRKRDSDDSDEDGESEDEDSEGEEESDGEEDEESEGEMLGPYDEEDDEVEEEMKKIDALERQYEVRLNPSLRMLTDSHRHASGCKS